MPVVIFVTFLVIASGLKFGIDQQDVAQINQNLKSEARGLALELEKDFDAHVTALRRMADRREMQPDMSKQAWQRDARHYLEDFGTYQAIEWIDANYIIRWLEPVDGNENVIGIQVAAEGVETEAQLSFLRSHRCDLAQGFLISRPIPADDLMVLLKRGISFESLTSES